MRNRRNNYNAVYCALLIISFAAIIVVLMVFLMREFGNKEDGGNENLTDTTTVTEATSFVENETTDSQTQPSGGTEIPMPSGGTEIPMPSEPVQTVNEYDLNGDGVVENVNVSVDNGSAKANIGVGSLGTLPITLEPIGANANQHLTVVGINQFSEKMLGAVEYTYSSNGMGVVKVHVWKYAGGAFIKTYEIIYSGRIGNQGFMDSGVIENRVDSDRFGYVAEENKNGYIYERSRMIADMKELGIKLPFETIGNYTIGYGKNITFFYDMDIK